MILYVIYVTTFKKEMLRSLNRFMLAIVGNCAYDLIWLLLNLKVLYFLIILE